MAIQKAEAIRIMNGIVSVDTQGAPTCGGLGCERGRCHIQVTSELSLADDLATGKFGDLALMCQSDVVDECVFSEIQELAREFGEKTR